MTEPDSPRLVDQFLKLRPTGSIARGMLLNFSLNLVVCLLWLPVCGLEAVLGASELAVTAAVAGTVLYIGVIQFVHVVPLSLWLVSRRQTRTCLGVLLMAGLTMLAWLIVFVAHGG